MMTFDCVVSDDMQAMGLLRLSCGTFMPIFASVESVSFTTSSFMAFMAHTY